MLANGALLATVCDVAEKTAYARRTKVRSAKSEGHSRVFAEGIPRIQLDRGHSRAKRLPPVHVDECKNFRADQTEGGMVSSF